MSNMQVLPTSRPRSQSTTGMQCRCSCRDGHLITTMAIVILLIARRASRWMRHLLGNLEMHQLASGRRQSRLRHHSAVLYPSIMGRVSLIGRKTRDTAG